MYIEGGSAGGRGGGWSGRRYDITHLATIVEMVALYVLAALAFAIGLFGIYMLCGLFAVATGLLALETYLYRKERRRGW